VLLLLLLLLLLVACQGTQHWLACQTRLLHVMHRLLWIQRQLQQQQVEVNQLQLAVA
jgi:hypothetical protein